MINGGYQPNDYPKDKENKKDIKNRKKAVIIALWLITISFFIYLVFGVLSNMNFAARSLGGNITVHLEENRKLVNITWKNDSMWILTREMRSDDIAEQYEFKEDSNFGVLEGTINLIEHRTIH